jgi:predicted GNAT family acetyltransferase
MKMKKITTEFGYVVIAKDVDFCNSPDGEDYVRIDELYVFDNFRGQGKAKELMSLAKEYIDQNLSGLPIKIIASPEPEPNALSLENLYNFYRSFDWISEVVAN